MRRVHQQQPSLLPPAALATDVDPALSRGHLQSQVSGQSKQIAIAVRRDPRACGLSCEATCDILQRVQPQPMPRLEPPQQRNRAWKFGRSFRQPLAIPPQVMEAPRRRDRLVLRAVPQRRRLWLASALSVKVQRGSQLRLHNVRLSLERSHPRVIRLSGRVPRR
jgi:hypothetical protein